MRAIAGGFAASLTLARTRARFGGGVPSTECGQPLAASPHRLR
ncbi:hypothetical protein [Paenibacillus sophorae]|nr:hypothetical protein [Paenibacillus sophorae]